MGSILIITIANRKGYFKFKVCLAEQSSVKKPNMFTYLLSLLYTSTTCYCYELVCIPLQISIDSNNIFWQFLDWFALYLLMKYITWRDYAIRKQDRQGSVSTYNFHKCKAEHIPWFHMWRMLKLWNCCCHHSLVGHRELRHSKQHALSVNFTSCLLVFELILQSLTVLTRFSFVIRLTSIQRRLFLLCTLCLDASSGHAVRTRHVLYHISFI